jgi:hypothetical protein
MDEDVRKQKEVETEWKRMCKYHSARTARIIRHSVMLTETGARRKLLRLSKLRKTVMFGRPSTISWMQATLDTGVSLAEIFPPERVRTEEQFLSFSK